MPDEGAQTTTSAETTTETTQAAQRPDFVPEKYWDAAKGQPNVEALGKGYSELASKLGQTRDQWQKEYDGERLKARPAKPDDYALKPPAKDWPAHLVLLDKAPEDVSKLEAGKTYFIPDAKDPLLGFWRQVAHKAGFSNDEFMQGIALFAEREGAKVPTEEERVAANKAIYSKLGENGAARADHVWRGLVAKLGENDAKALEAYATNPATVVALESLLEKAGEKKFAPGQGGSESGGSEAEARKIMAEPDYWDNPDKQRKVADIYNRLKPGKTKSSMSAAA
jgi:hypothetical protein